MNNKRKYNLLTGLLCLVSTLLLSGEKHGKFGVGNKTYKLTSHENLLHSGKYFYGGFSFESGDRYLNKIQFQVSNSNRKVKLDISYVSAATAGNIYYDVAFKAISLKKFDNYLGIHIGNDFSIIFFPKIDDRNLLWFNQTFTGISLINKYKFSSNKRIDFNAHIPIISSIIYNRFDRLTGEVPDNRSVRSYSGLMDKLFNADAEIGYVFSKHSLNWGIYYQLEINRMSETVSNRLNARSNSFSLRVIY